MGMGYNVLQENLKDLEAGYCQDASIQMQSIQAIESILDDVGYSPISDFGDDLNGWQIDFWYEFKMREPKEGYPEYITLSGSLYYGDFKLTKK